MTKQYIILAENYRQATTVCKFDLNPPLNPRDPAVVIVTSWLDEQKMRGRLFDETEIHVVARGPKDFDWRFKLAPYFPDGFPEPRYW